ncbi:MAG TPA: bacteriohemerythrin [Spirochaetia bacterium]|nr:bacteriohemerythrin [Spirochaetia bacterium]
MAFVEWKEEYSVLVPEMDNEHKRLFALINEFHDAIKDGKPNEAVGQTIDGLLDYTITHFAHEEKLMRQRAYKGLEEQERFHRAFTDKVKDYQARFQAGKLVLSFEVGTFMRNWLTEHIKQVDKRYSDVLAPAKP